MKTICIEELHEQTDRVIGEAAMDTILVTKNGLPQAILKPYPNEMVLKRHWDEREKMLARLPHLAVDTSVYISEDRDGR